MSGFYINKSRELTAPKIGYAQYQTGSPVMQRDVVPAGTQNTTTWSSTAGYSDDINLKAQVTWDKFRGPVDTGHTFWSQKRFPFTNTSSIDLYGTSGSHYTGPLFVDFITGGHSADNLPSYQNPPAFNVGYYGPEMIARTVPTASRATLLTASGEFFRDGIPKYVIGAGALRPKGIGHNALTKEFGWDPLISDLTHILDSLARASKLLDQLTRDDGRQIRRKRKVPLLVSNTTAKALPSAAGYRLMPETVGGLNNRLWDSNSASVVPVHTVRFTERVWFSGAYVYRLPVPGTLMDSINAFTTRYDYLMGLGLTAARLWELIPFSWLVDWVANVQSGLTAANELSEDGLVLKYGYLMRHTVRKDAITLPNVTFRNGGSRTVRSGYITETKERVQATPFGFGLSPSAFTGRQWAILAALGLSSSNRRVGW